MKIKKIRNPKGVIITTLILFLGLIIVASASAIYFLSNYANTLGNIVSVNVEQQYLYDMNSAATQRILYLRKMINSELPSEKNKMYSKYVEQGELFLELHIELKKLFIGDDDGELWSRISAKMTDLNELQNKIIELIMQDTDGRKISSAEQILIGQAVPAQDELLAFLAIMLEISQENIKNKFESSIKESVTAINIIIFISFALFFFGIAVSFWVLRHFQSYQKAINVEKNKAITANIKKSEFLASMSHEIRTPLTAIIGFSQAIKKTFSDKIAFDEMASKISRNSNHLLDVINDVLDLSKIEAGELTVETITTSPLEIIDEVVAIVFELAEQKGLLFESNILFPIPDFINSDPVRIKQILINLCSNAIKFTKSGSVIINVSFDHLQQRFRFEVIDSGIGMSPAEMENVFFAFNQANKATTRKFGGTGLGLNISKRLALKLNGNLTCTSSFGIGSKFLFELQCDNITNENLMYERLQLSEAVNEHSDITSPSVPILTGEILLVEDNVDNCELIRLYIDETHALLTTVGNGKQAIEECLAKQKKFDLILMDMEMPVMDGFEAVSILRDSGYGGPIVMLSANALKIDIEKSLAVGANQHLAKPIELEKFYAVLSQYLVTHNSVIKVEHNS